MQSDLFLSQLEIRRWAETSEAKWVLPHILRRLIWSTVSGISRLEFPAYEAGNRPGFDGVVVRSDEEHPWIPAGRSVWELSAENESSIRSKANRELAKRSELSRTPQSEQESSAFVFVTPQRFDTKEEWQAESQSIGHWRTIRVVDAIDLEHWIESSPAGLRAWVGRTLGTRPRGVDDVVSRWEAISRNAPHVLQPAVFLAGRQQTLNRLMEWISSSPSRLAVECRSPRELVDFFCAAVAVMEESARFGVESRAVIVYDIMAWETVRDLIPGALLVIDPALDLSRDEIARAVRNGHHVLIATDPSLQGQRLQELERVPQFELTRALEESGFAPAVAEKFARAAGGSTAVLKHLLTPPDTLSRPSWATMVSPDVLAACLLLGGWENRESDYAAFAKIAGKAYSECQTELQVIASSRDSMLLHAASKWRLISKDQAWAFFQASITPAALDRFQSLAVEILADDDPRFGLPEKDRFLAKIRGHIPVYSETIKDHVAQTLAFLGSLEDHIEAAAAGQISRIVGQIVASVLDDRASWHRWASLGSRLALLAEASPPQFLLAIERDLRAAEPASAQLFKEHEEPLFGGCNHAGLLWSLEGLAWSTRWLPQVVCILLELTARDTEPSRWSNRPKSSLREILSDWIPHTTATLQQRIQVLDLMIEQNADTAWGMLMELLPNPAGGVSHPTHLPYWRDWADSWRRGVTRIDSRTFVTAVAERLVKMAEFHAIRWKMLFERLGQLPFTVKEELLERAGALSRSELAEADRRVLADALSEQINQHRYFQEATWAIPEDVLDRLDVILEALKPKDLILRNAWLFEQWPDRFFERGDSLEDQQAALDNARRQALTEILEAQGFAGVIHLAECAGSPGEVGRALAMHSEDIFLSRMLPRCLEATPTEYAFACGFVWNRFWNCRWKWVDSVIPCCKSATQLSRLLQAVEFCPEAWSRAEAAGPETADFYWDQVRAFNPDLSAEDVDMAVRRLLSRRRPSAAIDLVAMALHKKLDLQDETLFQPLEMLLSLGTEGPEKGGRQSERHDIQNLIQSLQRRQCIDQQRLGFLEFHFINLLDDHFGHSPITLRNQLAHSPVLFNTVLSTCYRPRHRNNDGEKSQEPDAQQRYMAGHGLRLLHQWNVVPGTDESGIVDEDELRDWCLEARRIAAESDRLEVCDQHIGEMFAQSTQTDNDQTWPCKAIRRIAAEINTSELSSGMFCGICNRRGATWRSGGGDQERQEATRYHEMAERIRFDSPFVAAILDSVADSYVRDAERWDEDELWGD